MICRNCNFVVGNDPCTGSEADRVRRSGSLHFRKGQVSARRVGWRHTTAVHTRCLIANPPTRLHPIGGLAIKESWIKKGLHDANPPYKYRDHKGIAEGDQPLPYESSVYMCGGRGRAPSLRKFRLYVSRKGTSPFPTGTDTGKRTGFAV